jgi:hypothetical protein
MCGASSLQKNIGQEQQQNFQQLSNNAQQIFGNSSQIFKDLSSAFEPILAAGPGQSGFGAAELSNLQSRAITESGQAYRNAAQAAGERSAAAGGGNTLLPSGITAQLQSNIAQAGAEQTAGELSNIDLQNAQLGRQNWLSAAGILGGAPSVFGASTSAANAATGAGGAASQTANQISAANNSWMNLVGGALGGITGGLTSGLTGGLGKMGGGGGGTGFSFPSGTVSDLGGYTGG